MVLHHVSLRTDFNETDDAGLLFGIIDYESVPLVPGVGDYVRLFDTEGNSCNGVVRYVSAEHLVTVEPEWSSWSPRPLELNISISLVALSFGSDTSETEGVPSQFEPVSA